MGNQNKKRANDGFSAPAKNNKNSAGNKKTGITVICMVLVLALFVGVIVYSKVVDSGVFYRNTISVSSENFEVNNAMLSYFFNSQYQNTVSSLQQMGVDTSVNLKNAQYSGSKSWFDYLMVDVTLPQVERILVLCEAAKAAGFEMDEHQKEHIDEAVESIKSMAETYAKQYGGSEAYYIRNVYGHGVTLDDIRDAIELNQLAAAYSEHMTDSYDFTEEDWDAYLKENEDDFKVIDYVYYTFTAQKPSSSTTTTAGTTAETEAVTEAESEKATETETGVAASASEDGTTAATTADKEEEELTPEKEEVYRKATQLYQQLIHSTDEAAINLFNNTVRDHLENVVYASTEDADKKAENVQTAMDNTVAEATANDETNEFLKFAFSDDRNAKTYMTEDNTNGKYTVYLITKDPYIEEYTTKNIRAITLSAASGDDVDDAREAIIKEFEEKGKTEEAFEELAKTHSADAAAHENGGLYENQGKFDLPIDELNDWLYEEGRATGDYTYASSGENTEKTVYIIYYVGEGLQKWQRDVDNTMVAEKYDEEYQKLAETHKTTSDKKEAYKIPGQAGI